MTTTKAQYAFWTYAGARAWARGVVVVFCASLVALAVVPCCEVPAWMDTRSQAGLFCEDSVAAPDSAPCPGLTEVTLEAAGPSAPTPEKPAVWSLALVTALLGFMLPHDARLLRPAFPRPTRPRAALYRTTRRLLI